MVQVTGCEGYGDNRHAGISALALARAFRIQPCVPPNEDSDHRHSFPWNGPAVNTCPRLLTLPWPRVFYLETKFLENAFPLLDSQTDSAEAAAEGSIFQGGTSF